MYVCNCNGVTRREVDEAIAGGAQCPESVLDYHSCAPCCGRCLPEIAEQIGACCGSQGVLVAAE